MSSLFSAVFDLCGSYDDRGIGKCKVEEGIVVGGQIISDVRFADDQGMVASTEKGLQSLMNKLNDTGKKFNMKINVQKTKTMVMCKDGKGVVNITTDGRSEERRVGKECRSRWSQYNE